MKILYFDCGMGAAGDMLSAALFELIDDKEDFIREFMSLGIPGVTMSMEKAVKCGISGTHMKILVNGVEEDDHLHDHDEHEHDHHSHDGHEHGHHHDHDHEEHHHHDHEEHHHHHHHTTLADIRHMVEGFRTEEPVKKDILGVYEMIAEAEAHAHDTEIDLIHFHEVGTMDAVADVTAFCLLMHRIGPDRVYCSPVHVGAGTVRCAHGILPVPAPATAYILRDVPIYGGRIPSELCTPTGAALLKHFVDEFGDMPVMRTEKTGYGMGRKDFDITNCVRAFLGETADVSEEVFEISLNVDDMTAEEIGFACERLFDAGALDVYTVAVGMKKSRPGTMIRILCSEENREKVIYAAYRHTTTIGLRETRTRRYILDRRMEERETPYGKVRYKISSGYGVTREKPEYEDLAAIAREKDLPLRRITEK